jgi:hypothetical protein
MNKCQKLTISAVTISVCISVLLYALQKPGIFKTEFGEDNKQNSSSVISRREKYCQLLTEHSIAYKIEIDHLGRVWVVPDQSKYKEYEEVNRIWENRDEQAVKEINARNSRSGL